MRFAFIAALMGLATTYASAQEVSYPAFELEKDRIPISQIRARRDAVKAQLGPHSIAAFFTNPERNRNNDCDFRYRADSNFYYLTGFNEPDSVLILAPGGIMVNGQNVTEVLFVNENDPMSLTWLGYRMGSKDGKTLLGIDAVLPNDPESFMNVLRPIELGPEARAWPASLPTDATGTISQLITKYTDWRESHPSWGTPSGSLAKILEKMRVHKSPEELELLKHAVRASAAAHREVLRSVWPGQREFQLQAIAEYVFTNFGCESVGYNSIVGSGPNSCILHYEQNRRQFVSGDMICMDAAGEYHGYSADVTRSFPANGKFSPAQAAVYQVVLAAQNAGIAECKAGAPFNAAGKAAVAVIADGLLKLGITKKKEDWRKYMPHGVSHYIGLDVHDSQGDDTLKPGYALTVEPGIYIREGSDCDPKFWNIGIRIEDDILVTDKGPEILSAGAPRTIKEIEAMMKQTGIGKRPVGQ